MTFSPTLASEREHWKRIPESTGTRPGSLVLRSDAANDVDWDAFLLSTPLGQFQQSSAWARVKALENWRATRFIMTSEGAPVAGCQVLWKTKLGLRFGYISKGPVVLPGGRVDTTTAVGLIEHAARALR